MGSTGIRAPESEGGGSMTKQDVELIRQALMHYAIDHDDHNEEQYGSLLCRLDQVHIGGRE